MKKIQLTQGKFALVDDEDFEMLSAYKWCTKKGHNTFYAVTNSSRSIFPRETIRMHRLVLDAPVDALIDHIDGNGLNNTRANLRLCTTGENRRNHKLYSTSTTGFKGVSISKRRFESKIQIDEKTIHLGRFPTPEEAARAYDKAAQKYFGEFASPNFPENPAE